MRVNRRLEEWLGRSSTELLGSPFQDLQNMGGRIAFETHIYPHLQMKGYIDELSFDLLNKSGDRIPFIANVSVRRGDDGEQISTIFALFRADNRRVFEKNMLDARKTAEAATQFEKETSLIREQFIAVLGHDLRNPLTSIISGINIMRRRSTLGERENMILEGMSKSAWRAEHLIRDVLDFARGRMGEGLILQPTMDNDLTAVLTQVIDEIRTIEPERDIRADLSIDAPVYCDSDRIGQLLSNLLSNALTHGDSSREIIVSASTSDHEFTLGVENFGDPIPADARENLFQPFFRGSVRESREGLGLGLFIVSEIAKAHGGTVEVTSNELLTKFVLKMPLNAKAENNPL